MKPITIPDNAYTLWLELTGRLEARNASQVFDEVLVPSYSYGRYYHGLGHIVDCIEALRRTPFPGVSRTQRNEIELALWFHDLVCTYDFTHLLSRFRHDASIPNLLDAAELAIELLSNSTPEEVSASIAKNVLIFQMGLGETFADRVSNLILATDHSKVPKDPNSRTVRIIRDLDLLILATPYGRFVEYETGVEQEYRRIAGMSRERFVSGRIDWIERMLEKDRIFQTTIYRTLYERRARANLKNSLRFHTELSIRWREGTGG